MKEHDPLERLLSGPAWEEQQAVLCWRKIVGENLAGLAKPLYVEEGVLHLAVGSPVVANELRLWKEELLQRLQRLAPKSKVRDLRFHLVPVASETSVPPVEPEVGEWNRAEEAIPEDLPAELRTRLVRAMAHALAQEASILRQGGRRCPSCGVAFLGAGERCPLCRLRI
ncbi:MAG: DciA family protein [Candidatus Bipolaricaulaceae bacterium]